MSTQEFDDNVFSHFLESASVVGRLAKDKKAFGEAYNAFLAGDAKKFQEVLKRLELLPRCHLVCEWIRIKECIFLCLELCGLPKPIDKLPKPRVLAEAIVRITSNEKLVAELVKVLDRRDPEAFQRIAKEYKLEPFCHWLCHWLCAVRYRLVCHWVCSPIKIERPNLAVELQSAGQALQRLLEHKDVFDQAIAAANAGDTEKLSLILRDPYLIPICQLICEWLCSWRCTLVCHTLCREFPPALIKNHIEEAMAFAEVTQSLIQKPAEVEQLIAAVRVGDARAWTAMVAKLKLQRFCIQLCHWICRQLCHRFCFLECPLPPTIPLFTHVGIYKITTGFDADGTTKSGNFAFTQTIPLIGIMPDGTAPDSLEYRFTYETYPLGGAAKKIATGMIPATRIGELEFWRWDTVLHAWVIDSADYWVNNPDANAKIATINQQFGPPKKVSVNIDVKPDGWIAVPRENSLWIGGTGRFIPGGVLANLDTTKLTNEFFDLTVAVPPLPLKAGDAMPSADLSKKPLFKINFETRQVGATTLLNANSLKKIALSNTTFKYIRHPKWAGGTVETIPVLSLDVKELLAGGCDPLATEVQALFTAYHPYLGDCQVYLEGPGVPPPNAVTLTILPDGQAVFHLPGPPPQDLREVGFDISELEPCAYIVWISATLRLTRGNGMLYGTFYDHVAFCKR
jgi:hypothetical protein